MPHLSFASLAVYVCSSAILCTRVFATTLECPPGQYTECYNTFYYRLPAQNCSGSFPVHYVDVHVDARAASSLDITCGLNGAVSGDGSYTCHMSDFRCPEHGSCNIICRGGTGCKGAQIFCPKNGTCQITCEASSQYNCQDMLVWGTEGAAPIILTDGVGGTDAGKKLRVACPDGTLFENEDFKPPSELVCPTPTTTTTTMVYACNVAAGIGCVTCVAQASRTSDDDCATCNPGYEISGTKCQAQNCSMGDNCRYCRDGAVVLPDPQSPGHLLYGGGHCVLNSSKVCVDIYTHLPCSSDVSMCPQILNSNVEGEYLEPAWYQTCADHKRNYVMGPAGCNGGVDSVGLCKGD